MFEARWDKKKLFKKFPRMSASPTNEELSTGLGLFIVEKLIKSNNGRIWCESWEGKGAEFIVEFPAAETLKIPIEMLTKETA